MRIEIDLATGERTEHEDVPPSPQSEIDATALRRAQLMAQLTDIDAASARPLRAILAAQAAGKTADVADLTKLADLESQAVALRTELAGLAA